MIRNIQFIYFLNFTWSFLLIQAVAVPYFRQFNLDMADIFWIQTAFSLTLCIFDIPAGYLSDLFSRKSTLILASVLKALGGVALALASGLHGFVISYVLIGLGNSLYSGTDTALLYESREAIAPEERPDLTTIFGKRVASIQAGMMISAIAGSIIADFSLYWVIWANSLLAFLPLLIALKIQEGVRPPIKKARRGAIQAIQSVIRNLLFEDPSLRAITAAAIFLSSAPILAAFSMQGLWTHINIPLSWFGAITAFYTFLGILTGQQVRKLKDRLGSDGVLLLMGLLPVAAFLGLATENILIALLLGAAFEICRTLVQSVLMEAFNRRIGSELRVTANSVVSFGSRIFVAFAGPIIGTAAKNHGFSHAFSALALFYLLVLALWVRSSRTRKLSGAQGAHL